jgi:hypothetical protein
MIQVSKSKLENLIKLLKNIFTLSVVSISQLLDGHFVRYAWDANTNVSGDAEIDQLRRRLEETEAAMERIVAQIETAVDSSRPSSSLLKTVPRQVRAPVTPDFAGADFGPRETKKLVKNTQNTKVLVQNYLFFQIISFPFVFCVLFGIV